MSAKIYLWIEDRKGKASYTFWQTLMQQLYSDVIVESKKNNSELVKAVKDLDSEENKYIIVFDNSFDNVQVYQEQRRLQNYASQKSNVFLMDIICFEYILLSFDKLIEWIYAPDDEFHEKRESVIKARNKLVETLQSENKDYKTQKEIVEYVDNIDNYNIEKLSAKLLFELTRNTGFEVSKGKIGDCWIESCCDWSERQNDDLCGLDRRKLSVSDKMKSIVQGTMMNHEFVRVGLGVVL